MRKEDIANKLEQRENKHRQSVVKSIISEPIEPELTESKIKVSDFVTIKEKETRSKRISALIRPSVYLKVQNKCKKMGLSVNDVINQLLEQFAE